MSEVSAMIRSVGIRRALGLQAAASALPMGTTGPGQVQRGVLSPWQTGNLSAIVWSDVFGTDLNLASRAEAMSTPAIVKARQIIVGQLAGLPLRAMRGDTFLPDAEQPTFLYATSGAISPWHRMAWTLDDLIFSGWSLWQVTRGAEDRILTADRVPIDEWEFTPDGQVLIGARPVADARSVILFPGPCEGLLSFAARTIRAYRNTETAWQARVRNPVPITELHQTTDDTLEPDEVDAYMDAYAVARRDPDGALTFTPSHIELRVHGEGTDSQMYVEARNALRVDVANITGLPAAALDGSVAAASLTYVTTEGKFSELGEGLRLWWEPIEARLSQDDVVPRGQRVRFDKGDRTLTVPSPTGPEVLD